MKYIQMLNDRALEYCVGSFLEAGPITIMDVPGNGTPSSEGAKTNNRSPNSPVTQKIIYF